MRRKSHARFRGGENLEIISKGYLFLLASGCTGCDGKAIYATITKFISGAHWYDDAEGLIIEDLADIKAGDLVNKEVVIYAYYKNKAPKRVDTSEAYNSGKLILADISAGDTGLALNYDASGKLILGAVTAVAGTAIISVSCAAKPELATSKAIVVASN